MHARDCTFSHIRRTLTHKTHTQHTQALGAVVLETVFCALADGCSLGPTDKTCAESLTRLLVDIHGGDTGEFRRYCMQEPEWMRPTLLLDEFGGAGWDLVRALLAGDTPADALLANEFCVLD